MKITIHGVGYVGLVTGVCFAESGYDVLCFDIDQNKIQMLQKGYSTIFEPGLEALLEKNIASGKIKFTVDPKLAVDHGLYQFIAVSTPSQDDGAAELRHVLSVVENIAANMQDYKLVINKSTVPVGVAKQVRSLIAEKLEARNAAIEFDIASNPEFLREGSAVMDFMKPDRIVVGVDSQRARKHMRALYAPFVAEPEKIMMMDIASSELAKYASNAMLASRVSFMNEMSRLAEALGADIDDVRCVMGMDPRIGHDFLRPGPGYGGSCFPKDVKALINMGMMHDETVKMLQAIEEVNKLQKQRIFEKLHYFYNGELEGKTIAVWGLAFKANTDDVRETSSAVLIEDLITNGAIVKAYDPVASNNYVLKYGQADNLHICTSAVDASKGADCLVIMTEWQEFGQADYAQIKNDLRQPVIFDARNIFDPVLMGSLGFIYFGMGRGERLHKYTDAKINQEQKDAAAEN
jgi:UDPglucose 6-dehydrogenase